MIPADRKPNLFRCLSPVFAVLMALAWCLCCDRAADAHDIPRSESQIDVQGRNAQVTLKINLLELNYVDANGDGLISYDELDKVIDRVYAEIRKNYILRAPDLPTQVTLQRYSVVEGHVLQAELLYVFAADIHQVDVTSTFDHIMQQGHQHLVTFGRDQAAQEAVLDSGSPHVTFAVGVTSYPRIIWSFVHLGILHIFTGYDHLAFLLGLLIVTTNLHSLIKVVTSFTLAHSITLAVATFGVLILPSRVTESMIALSIAYVAIENLLGIRAIERYRITFLFGLVHGFGFSNVLREMQLSRSHLALSLFSFNTGVEIGQLAFVLLVFPLVIYLASKDRWNQVRMGVSLAVMCLAVYWFVQRAFLM
jgi:hypothetical protein